LNCATQRPSDSAVVPAPAVFVLADLQAHPPLRWRDMTGVISAFKIACLLGKLRLLLDAAERHPALRG